MYESTDRRADKKIRDKLVDALFTFISFLHSYLPTAISPKKSLSLPYSQQLSFSSQYPLQHLSANLRKNRLK